ncbi:MAG: enoyl-CoA hydratase/isomerase family protein [Candidatus Eremiobacteraeota bacterium]|nr:enoyl-CoA hydratase/isomerase family protein [Candidatus Eremiobacteraeota bacterium]MBC5826192.1 enoyl-CoA hydratase/isomerase family protein [Candidatus Eremiobacteraeota bacterium]
MPSDGDLPFENIIVERDGDTALITLNRPKALNALNAAVFDDLMRAFDELENDFAVRAVIITGMGDRAFAAGADIGELNRLADAAAATEKARDGHRVTDKIEHSRLPVIMAINGFALGGGLELALAGDIRLAADGAKLGQPEVNLGIIAGFGGTQRLPRLIGQGMASYLLLTGEMITAAQAQECNLVEKVLPADQLMPEAKRLASLMAAKGPLAIAATKRAIHRGMQTDLHSALQIEAQEFGKVAVSEDAREGTTAFLTKRPPQFTGR